MNGTGFAEPFGYIVVEWMVERIQNLLRRSPREVAKEIVKSGDMKSKMSHLFLALNLVNRNTDSVIRPREIRNYANRILKPSRYETDLTIKGGTGFDHKVCFNYTDVTRMMKTLVNSCKLEGHEGKTSLLEAERRIGLRKSGRKRKVKWWERKTREEFKCHTILLGKLCYKSKYFQTLT